MSSQIVLDETTRDTYESVIRLLDRAVEVAEGSGFDACLDMIADQMYIQAEDLDVDKLFDMYRYALRLVLRLKAHPEPRDFNIVQFDDSRITLTNYDYNTYVWMHDHGYCAGLSNDVIDLKRGELPPAIEEHLMEKAKE